MAITKNHLATSTRYLTHLHCSKSALAHYAQAWQDLRTDGRVNGYATIASSYDSDDQRPCNRRQDHTWPTPPQGRTVPTPYQILGLAKDAKYSKTRFYELVKLYHPDKHNSSCLANPNSVSSSASRLDGDVSDAIRLERYRLLVAAHDLLSDPTKRRAYDTYGAGWNSDIQAPPSSRRTTRSYPGTDPFIWRNATWEDWERWRERQEHQQQQRDNSGPNKTGPIYAPNTYFASLVILFGILGSGANYSRAETEGVKFLAARDAVHDRAAGDLRRVRQEISGMTDKEERIEFFVRARRAAGVSLIGDGGYGDGRSEVELEALRERDRARVREERVRGLLPPGESCMGALGNGIGKE